MRYFDGRGWVEDVPPSELRQWVDKVSGLDPFGTERWNTWGGQFEWLVGPPATPDDSDEVARIECPSPRIIRVVCQVTGAGAGGDCFINIKCGVGRVELEHRTVIALGGGTEGWATIEVVGRIVRVFGRDEGLARPAQLRAVIAPMVPWI